MEKLELPKQIKSQKNFKFNIIIYVFNLSIYGLLNFEFKRYCKISIYNLY